MRLEAAGEAGGWRRGWRLQVRGEAGGWRRGCRAVQGSASPGELMAGGDGRRRWRQEAMAIRGAGEGRAKNPRSRRAPWVKVRTSTDNPDGTVVQQLEHSAVRGDSGDGWENDVVPSMRAGMSQFMSDATEPTGATSLQDSIIVASINAIEVRCSLHLLLCNINLKSRLPSFLRV